jgi:hypothetical protein
MILYILLETKAKFIAWCSISNTISHTETRRANNFKDEIEDRLTRSLKIKIDLEKVYKRAKRDVLMDYPKLKEKLSQNCPYSLDELLN